MNKLVLAAAGVFFAASTAFAQTPNASATGTVVAPAATAPAASNCEAKAVDKKGKPLSGAAKASFVKKCEASASPSAGNGKSASCEAKAVGKNGKPLAGAAKTSFIKKCEASA